MTTGSPEELLAGPITNETWLPISQADARAQNNAYISYCSAKKEGELAIWSFVTATKPSFTTTVLLPALIFGPPLQPLKSLASLDYSTNVIYSLMNGTHEEIPATTFPSFVDVRDLADAHVKALTAPGARDKRLLVDGKGMTYTGLVKALGEVKELEGRLPRESGEDKKVVMARIEAEGDNKVLGLRFRTVEETMRDTAGRLLELERVFGVERE